MKRWFVFVLMIGFSISAAARCISDTGKPIEDSVKSPQQVVEELWKVATQGTLLTPEGSGQYRSGFRGLSVPSPGSTVASDARSSHKSILVMSNDWGVMDCTINGNSAKVSVEYYDIGRIDPLLRYSPGKESGQWEKHRCNLLGLCTGSLSELSDLKVMS